MGEVPNQHRVEEIAPSEEDMWVDLNSNRKKITNP